MAIVYDPKKLIQKIAPEGKIKKMLKGNVTLKRAALSFVNDIDFIDKKAVTKTALKVVKSYKDRVKADADEKSDILKDPKLLIQRVQNQVLWQVTQEIKSKYEGEEYEWLPSDAEEPDPEHQLLYGTVRTIGVGEMPGDRDGCKCGMRILVKQTELALE